MIPITIVNIIAVIFLIYGVRHIWENYPLFTPIREKLEGKFDYLYNPIIGCVYCMGLAWGTIIFMSLPIGIIILGIIDQYERYVANKSTDI